MTPSRVLVTLVSLLLVLAPVTLLGGCGGSGGAAADSSGGSNGGRGTISLSFPASPASASRHAREVPPSTASWRVDVRDPVTGSPLVDTLTFPISTPSASVTVRVGPARVVVAALNAAGEVLQEQSSLVEVSGSSTASVQLVFSPLHLSFLDPPAGTSTLRALDPFRVGILDDGNQVVTTAQDTITITLAAGPAGSSIVGTTRVRAVNGIATFTNVHVTRNQGLPVLRLGASSASAGTDTSALFALQPLPMQFLADSPADLGTLSGATLVAVGDLNGDGIPDAVLGTPGSPDISVFLNDGRGGFTSPGSITPPASPNALAVADVDRDGFLDVVAAGSLADAYVFFGRGDGTFPSAGWKTLVAGQNQGCVLVDDMNGDGRPDVVVGLLAPGSGLIMFTNLGTRNFVVSSVPDPLFPSNGVTHIVTVPSQTVANARDVIASHQDVSVGGGLQYYANDGTGTLAAGGGPDLGFHLTDMTAGEVAPHIIRVVGAYGPGNEIKVFDVTNGVISAAFTAILLDTQHSAYPFPQSVTLSDLGGAGRLDIVTVADSANDVQIFPGNGDGTFSTTPKVYPLATTGPYAVQVVDVNQDYLPDILCAGMSGDISISKLSTLLHAP